MKKLLFIFMLVFSLSLAACNAEPTKKEETREEAEITQLDTPKVSIDDNGLATWKKIKNADSYAYKINGGKIKYTEECEVQLSYGDSIVVKAVSDDEEYEDSDYSKVKTYGDSSSESRGDSTNQKLFEVFPGALDFESVGYSYDSSKDIRNIYREINGMGYVVVAAVIFSPMNGPVEVTVGVNNDGIIEGIHVEFYPGDFGLSDETLQSFIGQDATLSGVILTSAATVSTNAVKQAVSDSFVTLVENDFIKVATKTLEKAYEELIPTIFPGYIQGKELDAYGSIYEAYKSKNESGFVFYISYDNEKYLAVANLFGIIDFYKAVLIDEVTQTYILENTYIYTGYLVNEVREYVSSHISVDYTNLYNYVFSHHESIYIEDIKVYTHGSIVAAVRFGTATGDCYAYHARVHNGIVGQIADVFIALDSQGRILWMKVEPFFYNEQYFIPGLSFSTYDYIESLVGLDSWTYDYNHALIAGATYTTNAIDQAISDAFIAYNSR